MEVRKQGRKKTNGGAADMLHQIARSGDKTGETKTREDNTGGTG